MFRLRVKMGTLRSSISASVRKEDLGTACPRVQTELGYACVSLYVMQ